MTAARKPEKLGRLFIYWNKWFVSGRREGKTLRAKTGQREGEHIVYELSEYKHWSRIALNS